VSPTELSLRHLRADGWTAQVVETWNPHSRTRKDLFDVIDIIAVRGDVTLGVQATSAKNVSARIHKIADAPHIGAIRDAGWRVVVHGWGQKAKGARYTLREVDVS
jgi:hypothetical protein